MSSEERAPNQIPSETPTPPQPGVVPVPQKKGLLLLILIMVSPVLLVAATILLYAIVNLFIGPTETTTSSGNQTLFGEEPANPARNILNVILFLIGSVSVLASLPCFIVGLILLILRIQGNNAKNQS